MRGTVAAALSVLVALLVLAGCTTVAPAGTPVAPATTTAPAPAGGPTTTPLVGGSPVPVASGPEGSLPPAVATALLPDPGVSGERMFTLGQPVEIEDETLLEVVEGWVEPAQTARQARYTFLVRFSYPVPESPDPFGVSAGYYNAIGFSVRDDQGFEYDVNQGGMNTRQPELLFGNLTEGQNVQGWVTFEAPLETAYVDLVYGPVSRDPATFRVLVP